MKPQPGTSEPRRSQPLAGGAAASMERAGIYKYVDAGGDGWRVIVCKDVIAVPTVNWSGDNYGARISEEWLYHSGRLPKLAKHRLCILNFLIRCALAEHHGYAYPTWTGKGPAPVLR